MDRLSGNGSGSGYISLEVSDPKEYSPDIQNIALQHKRAVLFKTATEALENYRQELVNSPKKKKGMQPSTIVSVVAFVTGLISVFAGAIGDYAARHGKQRLAFVQLIVEAAAIGTAACVVFTFWKFTKRKEVTADDGPGGTANAQEQLAYENFLAAVKTFRSTDHSREGATQKRFQECMEYYDKLAPETQSEVGSKSDWIGSMLGPLSKAYKAREYYDRMGQWMTCWQMLAAARKYDSASVVLTEEQEALELAVIGSAKRAFEDLTNFLQPDHIIESPVTQISYNGHHFTLQGQVVASLNSSTDSEEVM